MYAKLLSENGKLRRSCQLFFLLLLTAYLLIACLPPVNYLFAQLSPLAEGIRKYRQGDLEGAVIDFELAFTQEKEDEKTKRYFLNCLVGIVYRYVDKKDYSKALPYAQRAYELDSQDEEIKKLYESVKKETKPAEVKETEVKKEAPPSAEKKEVITSKEVIIPKETKPVKEKEVITPKVSVDHDLREVKKETLPPPEKKEVVTPKETKPVEEKKAEVKKETTPIIKKKEEVKQPAVVQPPPAIEKKKTEEPAVAPQRPAEKKISVDHDLRGVVKKERKPLDDSGRVRIFQVLQKYRQGNFKETFAEFENLHNEYNDTNLKRTYVECLVGAATKLTEQKNYPDAFTYAKRAYELVPNDTAAERLYKNLSQQVETPRKR